MASLYSASRSLLRTNIHLRPGESVLIISDRAKDSIAHALHAAAMDMGARVQLVKLSLKRAQSSPIPKLKQQLCSADVVIAPTKQSITHCPETSAARKAGARVASMPGITPNLFIKAASTNYKAIKRTNKKLLSALSNTARVSIQTSRTSIVIGLGQKKLSSDDGDCSLPGTLINFPSGEVFVAPISAVNGILAPDVVRNKLVKGIVLKLKRGRIVGWSKKSNWFVRSLRTAGDCGLRVVEFGLGTNPAHTSPLGNILHDEKIAGSAHIAFGGFGLKRICPIHEDVIILKPSVWADRRLIIKAGKLML